MPATSDWPWPTGTTATTTTGSAREGEFLVVDPAFNALWAWSELALAELAEHTGADPTPHRDEADRITEAMVAELWSEQQGIFLARDARTGQALGERTVAGLLPLVLPGLPDPLVSHAALDLDR